MVELGRRGESADKEGRGGDLGGWRMGREREGRSGARRAGERSGGGGGGCRRNLGVCMTGSGPTHRAGRDQ
jgi:hypothetical protein